MEYFTGNKESWWLNLDTQIDFNMDRDEEIKDFYRIYFIRDGAAICILNGQRRWLESPAFLLLNELDEVKIDKKEKLKTDLIIFDPRVINNHFQKEDLHKDRYYTGTDLQDFFYLEPFLNKKAGYFGYIPVSLIIVNKATRFIGEISNELSAKNSLYWSCRSRSFLIELLFMIRRLFIEPNIDRKEAAVSQSPSDAEEVILYLHTHYDEKLTINDLARIFHTNRTTIMKKFKDYTSISISQYILQFRIRLSSILLRDTTLPVSEIMERAGFTDSSHFRRTFKKQTGFNPKSYRKRYNWILDPSVLP